MWVKACLACGGVKTIVIGLEERKEIGLELELEIEVPRRVGPEAYLSVSGLPKAMGCLDASTPFLLLLNSSFFRE
jgi:hypothetical protein